MTVRYKDMIVTGHKKQELLLYVVLWALLFAAPVIGLCFSGQEELGDSLAPFAISTSVSMADYDWEPVFSAWRHLAVYFVAFLLHNFFLAPVLVYANNKKRYFFLLALMVVAFCVHQFATTPRPGGPPVAERPDRGVPVPPRGPQDGPLEAPERGPVLRDRQSGVIKHERRPEPPSPFGSDKVASVIIMVMFAGLNIGAKLYFKTADDRKRMKELEHENLQQKMEALTYQLNPHFFMNTLNNIHALVSIDPAQAETTIEMLSDLMRYVLYEGSKPLVPLVRDLDFLRSYVDIMRIRCTDAVRIAVRLPEHVPDMVLPPLLFASFVENAFKHGVSYEHPSFIELTVSVDGDRVVFLCRNSRKPASEDTHGGVGLQNSTKRLRLLFGSDYSLDIIPTECEYSVRLEVPLRSPSA